MYYIDLSTQKIRQINILLKITNVEKRDRILLQMPMDAVFSSITFFLSFRDRIIENYDELFGEQGGETTTGRAGFTKKWWDGIQAFSDSLEEILQDLKISPN